MPFAICWRNCAHARNGFVLPQRGRIRCAGDEHSHCGGLDAEELARQLDERGDRLHLVFELAN